MTRNAVLVSQSKSSFHALNTSLCKGRQHSFRLINFQSQIWGPSPIRMIRQHRLLIPIRQFRSCYKPLTNTVSPQPAKNLHTSPRLSEQLRTVTSVVQTHPWENFVCSEGVWLSLKTVGELGLPFRPASTLVGVASGDLPGDMRLRRLLHRATVLWRNSAFMRLDKEEN